jgi:hypothetical protein
MKASKVSELIVTAPNKIGTMGKVFKLIADIGVNVSAFCAWIEGDKGIFRLVTDNNANVENVLRAAGYETRSQEAIRVQTESKIGVGSEVGKKLGDAGVDIQHTYATSAVSGESVCILKTADDDKAVHVLS